MSKRVLGLAVLPFILWGCQSVTQTPLVSAKPNQQIQAEVIEKDDIWVSTKRIPIPGKPYTSKEDRGDSVFAFYRGETLKKALNRWVIEEAGYSMLIWDLKNRNGQEVDVPIQAEHLFTGDLIEALSAVKKAYALAKPRILLDIQVKQGNKVVYISLLEDY